MAGAVPGDALVTVDDASGYVRLVVLVAVLAGLAASSTPSASDAVRSRPPSP